MPLCWRKKATAFVWAHRVQTMAWTFYAEKDLDLFAEFILVQCKKYHRDRKVSRPVVKQLRADVADRGASRGLLVTTSYFTKPALDYLDHAKYTLSGIDFEKLRSWLNRLGG